MRLPAALTLVGSLALPGCPKDDAPPPPPRDSSLGAQRCSGRPGPKNAVTPVLQRPFDGQYPVYNFFDHASPATSGQELTYCGIPALGTAAGYSGYAYALPKGTPVLAAADGVVDFAGKEPPFACPLTLRSVDDQLAVELRHPGLGGVGYLTRYAHLAKVQVKAGEKVVAGQRLGLSGQTGCATAPLLYFEVKRLTHTPSGAPEVVDPYGWDGPGPDPHAAAPSDYLWIDGEAPTLKPKS